MSILLESIYILRNAYQQSLMKPDLQTSTRSLSILCQLFSARMAALLEPHELTPAQFGILNHITPTGTTQLIDIQKGIGPALAGLFANIPESELTQFNQTTSKLIGWLDANRL